MTAPEDQAAPLLDEAGAPLLWALVAFLVVASLLIAGGLL
jgi:hypothetical protein